MFSQASVILSTEGRACVAEETATAADGTHPTGMHSCLVAFSKKKKLWNQGIFDPIGIIAFKFPS